MVKVGVIIVSFNTKELTDNCLDRLFQSKNQTKFEVVVVDNNSQDQTVNLIRKKYPQVTVVESGANLGFSKGNNLGASHINAEYYLFLNSDTEVGDKFIDQMLAYAQTQNKQLASCQLINRDGSFQPNGGDLPTPWPLFNWLSGFDDLTRLFGLQLPAFHRQNLDYYLQDQIGWVGGTVLLIQASAFSQLQGWDENIFMYGEDVDLCWRAKQMGLQVGWTNEATVLHIGGGSSKNPRQRQWIGEFTGLLYLYLKQYGLLAKFFLKLLIYAFILLRIVAFTLTGKVDYARIYGQIITHI